MNELKIETWSEQWRQCFTITIPLLLDVFLPFAGCHLSELGRIAPQSCHPNPKIWNAPFLYGTEISNIYFFPLPFTLRVLAEAGGVALSGFLPAVSDFFSAGFLLLLLFPLDGAGVFAVKNFLDFLAKCGQPKYFNKKGLVDMKLNLKVVLSIWRVLIFSSAALARLHLRKWQDNQD